MIKSVLNFKKVGRNPRLGKFPITKPAFLVVEVYISFLILSVILILGISIMKLMGTTLYDGQSEIQNRVSLSDNIFFITREIQSAENIIVTEKSLKIKQFGSESYNIEYTINEGYPFGCLKFKDKKMLDVDYEKSKFSANGNKVNVELAIMKNNLNFKQVPKIVSFDVTVRSEGGLIS